MTQQEIQSKTTSKIDPDPQPTQSLPKEPQQETKTVEEKRLPERLYEIFSTPIPEEHLFEYEEDGKTFTGYNAQYAIDLFNDTLGYGGWYTEEKVLTQFVANGGFVVAMSIKLHIRINESGDIHTVNGFGGSHAKNPANTYKGARTSSFKNACRFLGIGKELYKGDLDDDAAQTEATTKDEKLTDVPSDIRDKIESAKNVPQLDSLVDTIKGIEDKMVQKSTMKLYNQRKIKLME